MNENHKKYQIYYCAKKALPLFYVGTLYYLAIGLSYTNIAILSAIGTATSMLSEIPTGVIADNWSRKKSLEIAEVLKISSIALKLMGNSFLVFCISSLAWGIADSCQSGADEALLYESFDDNDVYTSFLSKLYSRSYFIKALSAFFSTMLFSFDIYLPLIVSLILNLVALFAIGGFEENFKTAPLKSVSLIKTNKKALDYIKGNLKLIDLLIIMSISMIGVMFVNSYTQPLLLEKGINLQFLGVLMLLYNLLMSFGANLQKSCTLRWMHYVLCLGIGICPIFMGAFNLEGCIIVIGCFRILNGMVFPQILSRLNKLLLSETRSTIMSFQNAITSIIGIILEPIMGIGLDQLGISRFYTFFGLIYTTAVAVVLFKMKRFNSDT